jgi:gluconate 2-dehydrogenase gamma chain
MTIGIKRCYDGDGTSPCSCASATWQYGKPIFDDLVATGQEQQHMETRRQVLQGLIFSLGGASALAAFDSAEAKAKAKPKAKASPKTKPAFYSAEELALVTFLADTILPRTDTPGAIDAGVPAYLDHLYLTWASEKTRAAHHAQLATIKAQLASFGTGPAALTALDAAAFAPGAKHWEYRNVKSLIATVYYVSEPGATQELQYEPVPGRWTASAPIAEIGRTWAL